MSNPTETPRKPAVVKFLVQIESDPETRWLYKPENVRAELERVAEIIAAAATSGHRPSTKVSIEP